MPRQFKRLAYFIIHPVSSRVNSLWVTVRLLVEIGVECVAHLIGRIATMRLQMILPQVEPTEVTLPSICPYAGCDGKHFGFHQVVEKPLRDTRYPQVEAHRYECLRCSRTFRVYPKGVTKAHISQRVKGLAVLLYLLGLSYGAVSLALEALGTYMCKSRVYDAVQAVAERVPGLRKERVFEGLKTPALGADLTFVKVNGQWLTLGLTVDDTNGLALTIDDLTGEDAVGR